MTCRRELSVSAPSSSTASPRTPTRRSASSRWSRTTAIPTPATQRRVHSAGNSFFLNLRSIFWGLFLSGRKFMCLNIWRNQWYMSPLVDCSNRLSLALNFSHFWQIVAKMGYISTASATGWLLKNGNVFAFSGRVYPITAMARVRDWSDYKWDFTTSCWLALLGSMYSILGVPHDLLI